MSIAAENTTVPTVTLNDGHTIPQLGFGVFKVDPAETERIVTDALEVGYRHIDTAAIYGNEEGVGRRSPIPASPATSSSSPPSCGTTTRAPSRRFDAFDAQPRASSAWTSVDLYLIHWPAPANDSYVDAWQALEQIREAGRARSIGVSNFWCRTSSRSSPRPTSCPRSTRSSCTPLTSSRRSRAFSAQHGILIEAWGPLGQGKYQLFDEPRSRRRGRGARQDARAGRHPLAPAAGQHRVPQVATAASASPRTSTSSTSS